MRFCILIVLAEIDNVLLPFSHANYTSEHTLMVMSYNRLYSGWETPRISLTDGAFYTMLLSRCAPFGVSICNPLTGS